MSHQVELAITVLVPEPADDASHVVGMLFRRPILVKTSGRRTGWRWSPFVGGTIHHHQRDAFFCKNPLIHSHERLQITLLVGHGLNSCDARVTPKIQECLVGGFCWLGQDRPLEHGGFCENSLRSPPVDLDQYIGDLRMHRRNAKQSNCNRQECFSHSFLGVKTITESGRASRCAIWHTEYQRLSTEVTPGQNETSPSPPK